MKYRCHMVKGADFFKTDLFKNTLRVFDMVCELFGCMRVRSDRHDPAAEIFIKPKDIA